MSGDQPARFTQRILIDTTPLPNSIPRVDEIGASSAPLMSASFFIGARCKDYNDDFMKCKTENPGNAEFSCLKEGRKVTRCASSVEQASGSIEDINKQCLLEFRLHWLCLEDNNQQMWSCRPQEWKLNQCVYDKLKLKKEIPDTPKGETPVNLRKTQTFTHVRIPRKSEPF